MRRRCSSRVVGLDNHAYRNRRKSDRRCSFCGRGELDVKKLIVGPRVFICDMCVSLCWEILNDDTQPVPQVAEHVPFPAVSEVNPH